MSTTKPTCHNCHSDEDTPTKLLLQCVICQRFWHHSERYYQETTLIADRLTLQSVIFLSSARMSWYLAWPQQIMEIRKGA